MADTQPREFKKRKFGKDKEGTKERKSVPSKAPLRLLKKKQRDLARLLQNKERLKDLPQEVVKETETKLEEITKQVEELSETTTVQREEEAKAAAEKKAEKKAASAAAKKAGSNALKFTELRRSGRKIKAFKKQHPNYEASEEQSKALADLELTHLYIKHFPKGEEYISIFPDSPLEDEEQIEKQAEIKSNLAKALANGEIKKTEPKERTTAISSSSPSTASTTANGKRPASNWSDDDGENEEDEDEEDEEEDNDEENSE
ncbi:hypothetical protein BGZ83_009894 [Gryganskiella cystojenkinii]|nr:hypothetical protein BGZ83_009894 [Gryganskiella cystojenkinii]